MPQQYYLVQPTKTGGTALGEFFTKQYPDIVGSETNHFIRCCDVEHPIIVIRHPVDRFISMFNYWKNGSERFPRKQGYDVTVKEYMRLVDSDSRKLFAEFTWKLHYREQSWWLGVEDYSKTIVIVYHEDLSVSIGRLLAHLGVDAEVELEKVNVTVKKEEVEMDDEDMKWIRRRYASDFELWDSIHAHPEGFAAVIF